MVGYRFDREQDGVINIRVDKEIFEVMYISFDQWEQFVCVVGDDIFVEVDVDLVLVLVSMKFFLEFCQGGGGWDGVEWYVDNGCDIVRGGCFSVCVEVFLFGMVWFVEVDMGVYQIGEQEFGVEVIVCGIGGERVFG